MSDAQGSSSVGDAGLLLLCFSSVPDHSLLCCSVLCCVRLLCTLSVSDVCLCRVPGFVDSRCPFAFSECKLNLEDFKDATGPGPLLNGVWKCRKCLLLAADHPKQEPSGQPFSFGDARRWERGLCFFRALRVLHCGSGLLLLEVHAGGVSPSVSLRVGVESSSTCT